MRHGALARRTLSSVYIVNRTNNTTLSGMPGDHIRLIWRHDPTRRAPSAYRGTCAYDAFVPERLADLGLMLDGAMAGVVSNAERTIRELNLKSTGTGGPLAALLLRTESLASSGVEGRAIGARILAEASPRAEVGLRVSVPAGEVLASVDAMQAAMSAASASRPFTTEDVVDIHRRLMLRPSYGHIAGVVRTSQCWWGGNHHNPCGAGFVAPPPEHVEPLLADLADAVNREDLPSIVQAALVVAQCETIQPFEDGNGPTARALAQMVLRRRGVAPVCVVPVSVVLAADREAYAAGLREFRHGDPVRWVAQYAVAADGAATLAARYLDAVRDLQAGWRRRLGEGANPRADATAWTVIELLPASPVISTASVIAATGRAKSVVHTAVRQLVESGVLLPLSTARRNRQWEAPGLVDLLERLDRGWPPGVKRRAHPGRRPRRSRLGLEPGWSSGRSWEPPSQLDIVNTS